MATNDLRTSQKVSRTRSAGRAAQVVAGLALVAGIATGSAGTAQADDKAPPDYAIAAPSTAIAASPGDSGRQYWASDACHYYVSGGQWYSDQCVVSGGNSVIDFYQNAGNGQLGSRLVRADLSDSQWLAVEVTGADGTPRSYRWSRANPNYIESLGKTADGQPIWVQMPKTQTSVNMGGNATGSNSGNSNPVGFALQMMMIRTQGTMAFCTLAKYGC